MKSQLARVLSAIVAASTCAALLTSVAVTPAQAAAGGNELTTNQELTSGQSICSSAACLLMQSDGNLVEYGPNSTAIWATGTAGNSGAYAIMQSDGNFVVYSSSHVALWSSATSGNSGAWVIMQNDGNVVVYNSSSSPIWANNMYYRAYAADLLSSYGWSNNTQYQCLNNLYTKESGWQPTNYTLENTNSGPWGIPQANPGSRMAAYGSDWVTNGDTQIQWGFWYIANNDSGFGYYNPCEAWSHEMSVGWYVVTSPGSATTVPSTGGPDTDPVIQPS